LRTPFLLQENPTGEDDVSPLLVVLEDLELEGLADEAVEIPDRSEIHLGARRKA